GTWRRPSAPRPPRPRKEPQQLVIPRSAAEEQRLRLERLMRNPEKTVPIPEKLNEWAPRPPPEFVRDVMGSSAGAGSGEFHVYRHLRRREYQRQDFMDAMAEKQRLDEEFQKKLERNKMIAEEQTAKRKVCVYIWLKFVPESFDTSSSSAKLGSASGVGCFCLPH
uniref:PRKR interacting protein 1 n=1 Tax=Malurus cyaneus samueli TaxID=2593467 RepID=A0A8C5T630_9PASS